MHVCAFNKGKGAKEMLFNKVIVFAACVGSCPLAAENNMAVKMLRPISGVRGMVLQILS